MGWLHPLSPLAPITNPTAEFVVLVPCRTGSSHWIPASKETQRNGLHNSGVKQINYDRSELLRWVKYRKLTGFTNEDINRIKLLNLRQSFRGKKGNKRTKWDVNRGVHHELLCALPKEKIKYENSKLLTVATANCQSIYNKIEELLATMIEDNIDICVINETWFNDNDASKRKLEEVKAILKQAEYMILNINRPRRGGGVCIIYRQKFILSNWMVQYRMPCRWV